MSSSLKASGEEESKKKLEFCKVDMPTITMKMKIQIQKTIPKKMTQWTPKQKLVIK